MENVFLIPEPLSLIGPHRRDPDFGGMYIRTLAMIYTMKLCLQHSGRVSGPDTITFPPGYSVIAGPNGSGKSTLLHAIHECEDCEWEGDEGTEFYYFNSETMNPHHGGGTHGGRSGSLIKVRAMFSSHGETMRDVLSQITFRPGSTVLLDEPENGHDLPWVIRIHQGLQKIAAGGVQVIAASHHPVFWRRAHLLELRRGYVQRMKTKYKDFL